MIENKFYFKDEFGQECETKKTYTTDVIDASPSIELMVVDFVSHLKNCGYTDDIISEFIELKL